MAYIYGIHNTDTNFTIDPVTRDITQTSGKKTLMQYDHNSECYGFEMPRFIDGHDMSSCNVTVHYINIAASKNERKPDSFPVVDLSAKNDRVYFSWLVSKNATGYAGSLSFAISFERNTNGVIDYAWHTNIFSGIAVNDTIHNDLTEVIETHVDILSQWQNSLFGIVDTEEARIKSVSEAEQEAIAAKGSATLATIPEDYTSTYNMAVEAVKTKGDAIIQICEGYNISVSDSSDDAMRGLSVIGKTTQKSTTGLQLCNFPDVESYTIEGITWSCKDGVITAKGTSTAIASSGKAIFYNFPIKAGTYYMHGATANILIICYVVNASGSGTYYQHAFTLDGTEKSALIYCQIAAGITLTETIYPMVAVEKNAVFETYSGGFESPSMKWPQELRDIGGHNVTVLGKNLINVTDEAIDAYKLYNLDLPAGTYTFSASVTSDDSDAIESLAVFKPVDDSNIYIRFQRDVRQSFTFTTTLPLNRLDLYAGTNYASSIGDIATWSEVQLEIGNEATAYEPCMVQTMSVIKDIPGVPVDYGGNYVDESGQNWVCDEIDFERSMYIERIQKFVFDGSEEWYINNVDNTPDDINRYFIANVIPKATQGGPVQGILCNVAKWSGSAASDSFKEDGCVQGYGFTMYPGWIGFALNNVEYPDVSAFKTKLTELNAAGTPVTVYVANYSSPVETPLTDVEIAAFKSLHSNYHNTTVLNSVGAYMKIKYNADTKLYIDNKFKELVAMMSSN